jgi:hypothetical protein
MSEQGLQSPSFDQAAAAYHRAVGMAVSGDSVRRVTEGWGAQLEERRQQEVTEVYMPPGEGRATMEGQIAIVEPLGERGNLSTDGTMILLRQEGWKEVKLTVISQVDVRPASERPTAIALRGEDPWVRLRGHSCQAGLWDADTMGDYQYVEGLRRGVEHCPCLTSVNDAAPWIERITTENFPQAVQIVDWGHAKAHLYQVAQEVFGEGEAQGQVWAKAQEEHLWQGQALGVAEEIAALSSAGDKSRQAQGFFTTNQRRMQYARFRAAGYPIGSGTVESGGKNYVQRRLKRPGPGWNRPTAQAMLAALSELHSGRFDLAWRHQPHPTILR